MLAAEVDLVLEEKTKEAELKINSAEKKILQMNKPHNWNVYVEGNMEREMEVEFEKFLINVSEHTNIDVEQVTIFSFYSTVEYLKQKYAKKPNKTEK